MDNINIIKQYRTFNMILIKVSYKDSLFNNLNMIK